MEMTEEQIEERLKQVANDYELVEIGEKSAFRLKRKPFEGTVVEVDRIKIGQVANTEQYQLDFNFSLLDNPHEFNQEELKKDERFVILMGDIIVHCLEQNLVHGLRSGVDAKEMVLDIEPEEEDG